MNTASQHVDLIELLDDRHQAIQKRMTSLWEHHSDLHISKSEWFIIEEIDRHEQTTIADITKKAEFSRQATHKFVKRLKEHGLVVVENLKSNRKKKAVMLTAKGKTYLEKHRAIKQEIHEEIAHQVGKDNLEKLEDTLQRDWGI